MFSRIFHITKTFLVLCLLTAVGIFLHEMSHHLFGVPSVVGLARNYPLVPATDENKAAAIIGTLAGPAVNLLLGYIGVMVYKASTRDNRVKSLGMFFGIANSFLALSGAVINLIVDILSGNMGNDLEQVSTLLGINIFILPAVVSILAFIPLKSFWNDHEKVAPNKAAFILMVFMAWVIGGAFLMTLDAVFSIRFRIIT